MPKMKAHKGLRKRIRVSATGKIKFKPANAGHLMSGKSGNRKRKLRKTTILAGKVQDAMRIAVMGKA